MHPIRDQDQATSPSPSPHLCQLTVFCPHSMRRDYPCPLPACDKRYTAPASVARHVESAHNRRRPLSSHIPIPRALPASPASPAKPTGKYTCSISGCASTFTMACNRDRHVRAVLDRRKDYVRVRVDVRPERAASRARGAVVRAGCGAKANAEAEALWCGECECAGGAGGA